VTTDDAAIKKARDAMEAARKKLMVQGKSGNGVEATYAEAYAQLCRLDPQTYRPLRRKYR
jgi:hypothetical protein